MANQQNPKKKAAEWLYDNLKLRHPELRPLEGVRAKEKLEQIVAAEADQFIERRAAVFERICRDLGLGEIGGYSHEELGEVLGLVRDPALIEQVAPT